MDGHTLTAPSDISGRSRAPARGVAGAACGTGGSAGVAAENRRGGGEMSEGGFTVVSVIIPDVITRVPGGGGDHGDRGGAGEGGPEGRRLAPGGVRAAGRVRLAGQPGRAGSTEHRGP